MGYREPGVYLELINTRPNSAFPPAMVPVIFGEGPKFFDHEDVAIVRAASGLEDILPASVVTAILKVSLTEGGEPISDSQYSLVNNSIVWVDTADDKPLAGTTYYVSFEARPEALQYEAAYVTTFDALEEAYGGMFMKQASGEPALSLNPVYIGAFLALEAGARGVYVVQVEPANKTTYEVVSIDYTTCLANKIAHLHDAYQLVPMTGDTSVVGATIAHCNAMSTVEEKRERVCFVGVNLEDPANGTHYNTLELTTFRTRVESINNKRARVAFVPKVTKDLADGNEYELPCEYFNAALAGLDSILHTARALTRQRLFNFKELKYATRLGRMEKNQLAGSGFMVIDQRTFGAPLVIRHGITTKVDNIADREHSVVKIGDFTSKYHRNALEGYIGVYNIDGFLITKIKGTLTGNFSFLERESIIRKGEVVLIQEDENFPDTLLVTLRQRVPYPCNYIDIKLLIE